MSTEAAGQGPVHRVVRPGAEARHLPTPEELRSYADDADQNGNHWVPIAPASLRGMADEFDRLRGLLGDPVGKRLTLEEESRTDGKAGPYIWWGNVPPGWALYCGPGPNRLR